MRVRSRPARGLDANGEINRFLRIVEVPVETSVISSVERRFERVATEIVRASMPVYITEEASTKMKFIIL